MELAILVLENRFLRVSVAPSLGGRIVELFDKRSQRPAVPFPEHLTLQEGGTRGVLSPFGIQLSFDGTERPNAMGPSGWTAEVDEEGASASITVSDSGSWPLSFHLIFEITEDTAEVSLRARVFNRSLELADYNAGLLCVNPTPPDQIEDGFLFRNPDMAAWRLSGGDLILGKAHDGLATFTRFPGRRVMSARQLDEWTAALAPVQITSGSVRFGSNVLVGYTGREVQIEASTSVGQIKLLVETAGGETLEANVTPSPEGPLTIPLRDQDLPLRGLAVLDQNRVQLIPPQPVDATLPAQPVPEIADEPRYEIPTLRSTREELKAATFDVRTRSLAHTLLAMAATRDQNWEQASYELEQALLFNGEDHLAWWLKARCERLAEPDADTSQEILNAHFLASMEPVLRVEALLNQAFQDSVEPNPILNSYADDRDAMLETSGQLIQAGLYPDAMRLISEWLRFQDFPMLRYLLGYCYLKASKMTIEAAEQLRLASQMTASAPYPVRPVEALILGELHSRWPDDIQLGRYLVFAQRHDPAELHEAL